MASPSSSPSPVLTPLPSENFTTSLTDLDSDALIHCASFLNNLKDISNMSMSCKYLQRAAYSDSIWQSLFRNKWGPGVPLYINQTSGIREAYFTRHTSLQQFKYIDPQVIDYFTDSKPHDHIILDKNDIIFSQGSQIHMLNINNYINGNGNDSLITLNDHNSRITCMRLFSLSETSLYRNSTQSNDSVLFTSSYDHSIRLWWKGRSQRCFRGHNGPVTTLSEKLLGDSNQNLLASGGNDGTIRLWLINSSGNHGQRALKATLYGHDKAILFMSVPEYKPSLLISVSKNSKMRVWDTTTSSTVRSSCCVGMTILPSGGPVGMKVHESLVYVASGEFIVGIDLRTMNRVFSISHEEELFSFDFLPEKYLICSGGNERAILWDTRKTSNTSKANPIAKMDEHKGPVKHIKMDPYKIVTGGPRDEYLKVWESKSGTETNSLLCCPLNETGIMYGCSGMDIDGCRVVSACSVNERQGLVRFRDFDKATCIVSSVESDCGSKFWWDPDSETRESDSD